MKYITVLPVYPRSGRPRGGPQAIVFSENLFHAEVAESLGDSLQLILSAGFCSLTPTADGRINVTAWGESESLGIKSNIGDEKIIYNSMFAENRQTMTTTLTIPNLP